MSYVGVERNEYGTPVSTFDCDKCGGRFTICPEPPEDQRWMWQHCMAPECESYDVSRDVAAIVGFEWGALHDQNDNTITLTHEGNSHD